MISVERHSKDGRLAGIIGEKYYGHITRYEGEETESHTYDIMWSADIKVGLVHIPRDPDWHVIRGATSAQQIIDVGLAIIKSWRIQNS